MIWWVYFETIAAMSFIPVSALSKKRTCSVTAGEESSQPPLSGLPAKDTYRPTLWTSEAPPHPHHPFALLSLGLRNCKVNHSSWELGLCSYY